MQLQMNLKTALLLALVASVLVVSPVRAANIWKKKEKEEPDSRTLLLEQKKDYQEHLTMGQKSDLKSKGKGKVKSELVDEGDVSLEDSNEICFAGKGTHKAEKEAKSPTPGRAPTPIKAKKEASIELAMPDNMKAQTNTAKVPDISWREVDVITSFLKKAPPGTELLKSLSNPERWLGEQPFVVKFVKRRDSKVRDTTDQRKEDQQKVDLFSHEFHVLPEFQHPSIPVVEFTMGDLEESEGRVGYAVRASSGDSERQTLRQKYGTKGAKDKNVIKELMGSIFGAVDEIHKKGYVHLGLNPDTIIVFNDGAHGKLLTPMLTDFRYTRKAVNFFVKPFCSQLPYIAPELFKAGAGNPDPTGERGKKANVFTLGAITIYLITGNEPKTGHKTKKVDDQTEDTRWEGVLESGSAKFVGLSKGVKALCLKMVDMEPANRPTMKEVMEEWAKAT